MGTRAEAPVGLEPTAPRRALSLPLTSHASALFLRALERVGLAWNVDRISPERQARALAGAG
jgi:hypothetical protein